MHERQRTYISRDPAFSGRRRRTFIQQSLRGSLDLPSCCMRHGSRGDEEETKAAKSIIWQESNKHLHLAHQDPRTIGYGRVM